MATDLSLIKLYQLAAQEEYRAQVQIAAIRQAGAVLIQPASGQAAADTKRLDLAVSTIADGCVANLDRFARGIASAAGVDVNDGSPPTMDDAVLLSALVSQWDTIAGVTSADKA